MTREEISRAGAHILATSVHELTWSDGFETGVKFIEEKNGKELLYVAQKTAERTKKEIISKACEWLKEKNNMCMYELEMILGRNFIEDFKKAMEL